MTRDRGSASLTIVLLAPLLLVLMFAGFQAAMWNHTRTEARVIARETAVLVARDRLPAAQAAAAASASLAHDSVLTRFDVAVDTTGDRRGCHDHRRCAWRACVAPRHRCGSSWRSRSRDGSRCDDARVTEVKPNALGLVLIAPVAVALAMLILWIGRKVDTDAQVQAASSAAAQAAARQRSPISSRRRCAVDGCS